MSASPLKILIVDDTPANIELLDTLLRLEGFDTLTAENGEAARSLAIEAKPDLILLSLNSKISLVIYSKSKSRPIKRSSH